LEEQPEKFVLVGLKGKTSEPVAWLPNFSVSLVIQKTHNSSAEDNHCL
jgi:hypothetical protein